MKTIKLILKIMIVVILFTGNAYSNSKDFIEDSKNLITHDTLSENNNISEFENQKKIINEKFPSDNFINNNSDIFEVNMTGHNPNDNFGASVANAGDVNGDGYDDLIVGAFKENLEIGRAYIYFGGPSFDTNPDVTLNGSSSSYYFGFSVSSAGDVNNDGYSDVIVGAYYYSKAYIFFGGINMDNIADVNLSGETPNDNFGFSLSAAGDVNDDGYSDVAVASPGIGITNGRVYVYLGGPYMDNIADITIRNLPSAYYTSVDVSNAGDVNSDGYSDIIIGCAQVNSTSGNAYIYFGGVSMNDTADVIMTGESYNSYFGQSVSPAGDVNRDGYDDVLVGGARYNTYTGCAYIFYGGSTMNNVADVSFYGEETYSNFGINCSAAGDLNHDGFSDVIIGANRINQSKGRSYIYYGSHNMDNVADTVINGENSYDNFGSANAGMFNLTGDGKSNVVIGAFGFNSLTGKVKIFSFYEKTTTINISAILEGFYDVNSGKLLDNDTLHAYLRNINSPYLIIDSSSAVIDSILHKGNFKFTNVQSGTYYIVLKSRNGLETWSNSGGVTFAHGDSTSYNFTNSASQAFGNNQILKGSRYCIYSGDVSQDGIINLSDLITIYNDASNFINGRFLGTDLTGDNIVDLTDVTIGYNNSTGFISKITP